MPNILATLMLVIWPLVTAALYMRLPVQQALVMSVLSAYLLLPMSEIDLPLLPGLSKYMIPAFFGYLFACMSQGRLIRVIPRSRLARIFLAMVYLGLLGTTLTNPDPIFIGPRGFLPGLRPYDALSMTMNSLGWLLVWALAREFLNDREGLALFARSLAFAMLIYSLPMLYEIRMSPQLHTMVYGFFQHSFDQMMRQGGFRPIVFLEHGLWVAMITAMAALAALVLARAAPAERKSRWYRIAGFLTVMVVLCKSMAALLYVLALAPIILFAPPRLMLRMATVLAAMVLAFPMLRGMGLIPIEAMVELAAGYSEDRAQSLGFRFSHEDAFLARVAERPVFGWGSWGRNAIYDPITGESLSVSDGQWIITMSMFGYVGFIGFFGLMVAPILVMGHAFRRAGREVSVLAAGMALVLTANLVDLLPNATLTQVSWLLAGGLLGYVERLQPGTARQGDEKTPSIPESSRPRGFAGLVGAAPLGQRSLL